MAWRTTREVFLTHLQTVKCVRFGEHLELRQFTNKSDGFVLCLDVDLILLANLQHKQKHKHNRMSWKMSNMFYFDGKITVTVSVSVSRRTYMEPEVSFQHGAEVLGHVRHAGVESRHQAGVEGQEVQPARGEGQSSSHPQTSGGDDDVTLL